MCPEIANCPLGSKSPSIENECFRGRHCLCVWRLFTRQISLIKQSQTKAICLYSQNMQKHQWSMVKGLSTEALILTSETRSVFQTCIKYLVNLHLILTYTHTHIYTHTHTLFIGPLTKVTTRTTEMMTNKSKEMKQVWPQRKYAVVLCLAVSKSLRPCRL